MEQAKIEQLAFLYLCSEHDKRLLLKKEKMPLADFDRLTYLIYHFGFKEYHIKVWMEFAGEFKKEWDCLEALHETGGCVGNIGNTGLDFYYGLPLGELNRFTGDAVEVMKEIRRAGKG